jgi:phospholipase C
MFERYEIRRLTRRRPDSRPGPRPRPELPEGTDLLPQIRHIVVLMMENHSFDNYLGMLGRGEGLPRGPGGEAAAVNHGRRGETVRAFHLPSTVQRPGVPSQSWRAAHRQWGEGKCDGFVTSAQVMLAEAAAAGQQAAGGNGAAAPGAGPAGHAACGRDGAVADETVGMGYWDGRDLPFYHGLAQTFPVADRWFSSCLGPTFPNRRFLIAGTANGLIDDSPYDLLDYPAAGTVFDLMTRNGISWANYHPVAGDRQGWRHFGRHKRKMARRRLLAAAGRPLPAVAQGAKKDIAFTADVFPLGIGRYMRHIRSIEQFLADADNGTLPGFSIVDPDFGTYSEENPQDIQKGESFAAEIINRVMHGRGWPHTLLIWVYDEHGGYYDHVPPPPAVPPDDVLGRTLIGTESWLDSCLRPVFPGLVKGKQAETGGPHRYDRYGFRVPAVIVSPYARPGYVCSRILDHTSVLRLAGEKWNLPPLTARDAAASTPLDTLDLEAPPAFLDPPGLPDPALKWGAW